MTRTWTWDVDITGKGEEKRREGGRNSLFYKVDRRKNHTVYKSFNLLNIFYNFHIKVATQVCLCRYIRVYPHTHIHIRTHTNITLSHITTTRFSMFITP